MKSVKEEHDWREGDSVWDVLGKAKGVESSGRFVDDAVRAVKLLPEGDGWWPRVLRYSPLGALAACLILGMMFLMNGMGDSREEIPVASTNTVEESWTEIEEVVEVEMLVAAADHLDEFSDQELVSLIGF